MGDLIHALLDGAGQPWRCCWRVLGGLYWLTKFAARERWQERGRVWVFLFPALFVVLSAC